MQFVKHLLSAYYVAGDGDKKLSATGYHAIKRLMK